MWSGSLICPMSPPPKGRETVYSVCEIYFVTMFSISDIQPQ